MSLAVFILHSILDLYKIFYFLHRPDWLRSRTPHRTCKSSPWSGWHAGCRLGPPWGPSEPRSDGDRDRTTAVRQRG